MKKIMKQFIAIALTVIIMAGIVSVPASASETPVGFAVRYMDSSGTREITSVEPGEIFRVVISSENADNLTGFALRLYYDKTYFETLDGEWSEDIQTYEEKVCSGEEDSNGNFIEGTALSPQKDINYEKDGVQYTNITWSLVNKTFDDSILTKGMGDIDICSLTLKASEEASDDYSFSIERRNILEHGRRKGIVVEEEAVVKNTLLVEERAFEEIPMTGFELDQDALFFDIGLENTSGTLSVTNIKPQDTTDELLVVWKSSDETVVTVDSKGKVTAVGEGTAVVFADVYNSNNEKITRTCEVTVVESLIGKWRNTASGWWFEETDGSYPYNRWAYINGTYYYFDASGYMAANKWVGDYYVGADGARKTNCWVGSYYVGANGIYVRNAWVDGGKYYVGADGIYARGWLNLDGAWYYLGSDGALKKGWISVGGIWYYGDSETGVLYENRWLDDTYYFRAGGAMATGWVLLDSEYYYFAGSGAKVTSKWVGNYYMQADGVMATKAWVDKELYYVDSNGIYQKGWLLLEDTWYYLGADGARKTGWQKISSEWYYFYQKNNTYGKDWGAMAYSCEIDGCLLDENGCWIQ